MYDIHFILPITEKKPYNERIFHLKKYAFLNPKHYKVLITFLGDKGDKYELLQSGWIEGITVEILKYPTEATNAYKVNHYLSKMDKPLAKWTAKIDDDTTNDIASLCSCFDEFYDWEKEYYLADEINTALEHEELVTLKALNLMHYIKGTTTTLMHEFEGCFVSWGAMNAILKNELAISFLKERIKLNSGFTDQAFAMAAQMAKVYPTQCRFLGNRPEQLYNFSLFGGQIGHIHFYVNHLLPLYNFWLLMFNEITGPLTHITSRKFTVYYENEIQKNFTFTKNGIIKINGNIDNWRCYWTITDDIITFLDSDLRPNASFQIQDDSLIEPKAKKSVKII